MRLAILADIHGNVLALEAVLADLRETAPDLVVNLGDCASGPLWPRETIELLMARDWPTVRGNHDRLVAETPRAGMSPSDACAWDSLDEAQRNWLGALPAIQRRDDLLMFHAQPARDDAYLLEKVSEQGDVIAATRAHVEARLRGESAPLVLCGHTHLPRLVRIAESLIVNPGSVGCPGYSDDAPVPHVVETGAPHARYALATRRGSSWTIDLRAIAYDWDAAARRAARNGREDWARALASGFLR